MSSDDTVVNASVEDGNITVVDNVDGGSTSYRSMDNCMDELPRIIDGMRDGGVRLLHENVIVSCMNDFKCDTEFADGDSCREGAAKEIHHH